jgi:hypothetical protein
MIRFVFINVLMAHNKHNTKHKQQRTINRTQMKQTKEYLIH